MDTEPVENNKLPLGQMPSVPGAPSPIPRMSSVWDPDSQPSLPDQVSTMLPHEAPIPMTYSEFLTELP